MAEQEHKLDNITDLRPSFLQRFFIICSGSDKSILSKCSSEWNKYAGIGATIFFTGLLAALSGGYALFSIFRGDYFAIGYAIIFGIVWGLLLFNLDRFIVSSIRKENNIKKELWHASPRFVLAIIISVVIAKPLEVKIFENRIEQQILENKFEKLVEEKEKIQNLNELSKLENQITDKENELKHLDDIRDEDPQDITFQELLENKTILQREVNQVKSRNNKSISDRYIRINAITSDSSNYNIEKDSLGNIISKTMTPKASQQIKTFNNQITNLKNEIRNKEKQLSNVELDIKNAREYHYDYMTRQIRQKQSEIDRTNIMKASADSIAQVQYNESLSVKEKSYTNNLITQLEALGNLTKNNRTIRYTSWMIMLLFIVVETAPIVVKLISKRGPYDVILEHIEQQHLLNERDSFHQQKSKVVSQHDLLDETLKMERELDLQIEKMRLEHEKENNEQIMNEIAQKQQELASARINKWFNKEMTIISELDTPSFANKFWNLTESEPQTEYYFSNGTIDKNQLIIIKDNILNKATWSIDGKNNDLCITIGDEEIVYSIIELSEQKLILADKKSKKIIEFESKYQGDSE